MADDPSVNGLTIAADDVGGKLYQWIKLVYGDLDTATRVTIANGLPMRGQDEVLLLNDTIAWANSAAANTEVTKDLDLPGSTGNPGRLLAVFVRNPSTETDILIQMRWELVDSGSTTRRPVLSTPTGPSVLTALKQGSQGADAEGYLFLIDGGIPNLGGRLSFKNVSAVGGSGAFTGHVKAWALSAF